MSDKWIEQPAFETNEFKLGDWFIVYSFRTHDGQRAVRIVDGDYIHCTSNEIFHFKQCRLLKKREAREWKLPLDTLNFHARVRPEDYMGGSPLIKVREVLDD